MDTRQLNLLNIGLMIFSTVVAFILPFELFLFSYAVLGPLHPAALAVMVVAYFAAISACAKVRTRI